MRNATNFRLAVVHGVEAFALAADALVDTARLAKIDIADLFADEHEIKAADKLRLQWRRIGQLGKQDRRS